MFHQERTQRGVIAGGIGEDIFASRFEFSAGREVTIL
jgi:hypothetical protein